MRELIRAYPTTPEAWLELAWNFHEFTPKEEQDNIVKNKLWEGKPSNRRNTGGSIPDSISVMTKEAYALSKQVPTDSSGN